VIAPDRLVDLLAVDAGPVPLDEALLLLAASRPGADPSIGAGLDELDRLARTCPVPTLDGLVVHLFGEDGFRGDRTDYHDPRNSLLDEVLARRVGMPITLSVVLLETGRRLGVPLVGIGMPGHFLVRDGVDTDLYVDAYQRGTRLGSDAAVARFRSIHGPRANFDPAFLRPVDARSIVVRVLNNLTASLRMRRPSELDWLLDLRLRVPAPPPDQRALAELCELRGRFDDAATLLDRVATSTDSEAAAQRADRLRARLN
jgi:regulator of sirC expression with transglutaminase-like and TPR domain